MQARHRILNEKIVIFYDFDLFNTCPIQKQTTVKIDICRIKIFISINIYDVRNKTIENQQLKY